MHTRRLASFILGAWLVGCLLMSFVSSQGLQNVDRLLTNPPGPVAKDVEDLGADITRMLLRYQASEMNRFLFQVWGVLQLGLGGAFVISSVLTSHRSKFLIGVSLMMMVLIAIQMFYVAPAMNALSRSLDFLQVNAAFKERDAYQSFRIWDIVLEILKMALGLALAARLLFDRYAWKQQFGAPQRISRRKRRVPSSESLTPAPAGVGSHGSEPEALEDVRETD